MLDAFTTPRIMICFMQETAGAVSILAHPRRSVASLKGAGSVGPCCRLLERVVRLQIPHPP